MAKSSVSKRSSNAHKIGTHPLYSKPCRGGSAWIVGLLVANNLAACAFCFTLLALTWYDIDRNGTWSYDSNNYVDYTGHWKGAVAFDIIFLSGLLIVSVVDTVHRYQRRISAKRIVITACSSIIVLIVWALTLVYAFNWFRFAFGVLVFGPTGAVFNLLYLVIGAMALRRERKGWKGAGKVYVEELNTYRTSNLERGNHPSELSALDGRQSYSKPADWTCNRCGESSIVDFNSTTGTMTTSATHHTRNGSNLTSPSTTMTTGTTRPPSYWSSARAGETIIEEHTSHYGKQ